MKRRVGSRLAVGILYGMVYLRRFSKKVVFEEQMNAFLESVFSDLSCRLLLCQSSQAFLGSPCHT